MPVKHNLVDDKEVMAEMTAEMLATVGYKETEMTRSLEIQNGFSRHAGAVDLVITDQIMPTMTCLRMVAEIRKLKPDN